MQIQQERIEQPLVTITTCLTNSHGECTGTYVDTANRFKIQCKCRCHQDRYATKIAMERG